MKLVIDLDEETQKISAQCVDAPRIDDMLTVLFSVQLNFMNQFMKHVESSSDITPDQLTHLKEDLYDKYNAGASNVLYLFAPDIEMHPDLTVEAMKEAEDRYMYNQLNRKARREVDKKTHNQTKILRFPNKNQNNADNT